MLAYLLPLRLPAWNLAAKALAGVVVLLVGFSVIWARQQHLTIVCMRAAENRRWILRSTNDGITGTIDPAGRVRGMLPLYTQATSYTGFNYITDQTFYTKHGDWFPWLCAVVAAGCLVVGSYEAKRKAR